MLFEKIKQLFVMFYHIFQKSQHHNIKIKIKNLFISYLCVIALIAIVVFLLKSVDSILIKLGFASVINVFFKSNDKINHYGFLKVAIIAPIIEEVLFRIILKPYLKNLLIFSFCLVLFIINGTLTNLDIKSYNFYFSLIIGIFLMVFVCKNKILIQRKILNNIRYVIVIYSILFFGLLHLNNIKNIEGFDPNLIVIYPIFTLPQIIMAYFITNLRIKYGFVWGYLLHIIINSMSFIL